MMHNSMWIGHWLWMLMMAAVVVVPFWRICTRVGYSGWLSLLMLVPIANLVLLYFIAFSRWPINSPDYDHLESKSESELRAAAGARALAAASK